MSNWKENKKWKEWQEKNSGDAYSAAVIDVARRCMEILDKKTEPLKKGYKEKHSAFGIICRADREVKAGGITGFQASIVRGIIFQCHERGAEFRESYGD